MAELSMNDHTRRDSLVTIMGLAVLVLGFIFGIFLPEHRANRAMEQEIDQAKRDLLNVPLRMAELDALNKLVDQRNAYIQRCLPALPADTDDQRVLKAICRIADQAGIEVTHVRPKQSVTHQTYRRLAFEIEFRGSFSKVVTFLHGMETQQQLFHTRSASLTAKIGGVSPITMGQLSVETYAIREDFDDSDENSAESNPQTADNRRWVSVASQDPCVLGLDQHRRTDRLDPMPFGPAS